jgi:Fe2+ or Zn2+ uptake regulation protein
MHSGSVPETKQDEAIVAIAQEISAYLKAHPEAADSLEGVARWWLARQHYEQAINKVKKALEYLVAEGVVTRTSTTGGNTLYSSASRDVSGNQTD